MRVLLFTGKGGVGKTTTAAATAAHAARLGLSTLLLSTDATPSLGTVLGVRLPPGRAHRVARDLLAEHVDPAVRVDPAWGLLRAHLARTLALDPAEAGVLHGLSGAADLAALLTVRSRVRATDPDLVVVDCAASAEALRLLALPEVVGRLVDRLLPRRRLVRQFVVGRAPASSGGPGGADTDVTSALLRLRTELADVRGLLHAPGTCVRAVCTPETVVVAETRRVLSLLALHGYAVDAVVANRVVPDGGDGWRRSWARAQRGVLAAARTELGPVPVLTAPYLDREPVGVAALADLGAELLAGLSPAEIVADPAVPAPVRVEPDGDDFELVLDLGLPPGASPELSRLDDDLLVDVPGGRRLLPLPSVLRRCEVAGARVREGAVRVRFERDPDLWPVR